MRRRTMLGSAAAVVTAAGLAGYRIRTDDPDPLVPTAPAGVERLERRYSKARGQLVDFYTAVPYGHGTGRGLPVCLILHGGSKTPADYAGLGLGRFLTEAVNRGAPPFVLAGADGGKLFWRPSGRDDPQRLAHEEIPLWCRVRAFDTSRIAAWGWSMGGYGSLALAEAFPGFLKAVAAFSPAIVAGDDVTTAAGLLRGTPVGLWCGRQDGLYEGVQKLALSLPQPPAAGGFAAGRHNFSYWSRCVPDAFDFLARALRA